MHDVHGQALSDHNDTLGVIVAQPQSFENHIRKGTGSGNDPVLQPFDDTLTGGIQVKGQQMLMVTISATSPSRPRFSIVNRISSVS